MGKIFSKYDRDVKNTKVKREKQEYVIVRNGEEVSYLIWTWYDS